MKSELTLLSLYNKIKAVEKKLNDVITRLESCQQSTAKVSIEPQGEQRFNALDLYLKNIDASSQSNYETYRRKSEEMLLSQSKQKQRNYYEKMGDMDVPKLEPRADCLDSNSFAIIKNSILANTEQIEQTKERVEEVEQKYMRRIMDVEEGVRILTRLTEMIDTKIETIFDETHTKNIKVDSKIDRPEEPLKQDVKISKIIAKYQKWSMSKHNPASPERLF